MTPTPEMIAMAERIAGDLAYQSDRQWDERKDAALTAIMEVSEKAAHHLFTLGEFEACDAIRNGEYLRCQ